MATESSNDTTPRGATIGASVCVKGEISGDEDILIEGSVEGSINLKKNAVIVAKTGKVKANVAGVTVHVEGEITGDVFGSEQVVIHRSGRVVGNVSAPRISLEDGARVKGLLDTESFTEATRSALKVESGQIITPTRANGLAAPLAENMKNNGKAATF